MILDSTFLYDLIEENPAATDMLEALIEDRTTVAISALTVDEVGVGLRGEAHQKREKFDSIIDELEIAQLGTSEARRAISIQHSLLDAGERIGSVDAFIAATAAQRPDATVLTRNVDEFSRVDAISVESY